MTDCVAIGDSIAVGIAQAGHCVSMAQVGRTSSQQAAIIKKVSTDVAIISLGSNDPTNPDLLRNLRKVRAATDARRVVWIMPYAGYPREAVARIASDYRDGVLDLRGFATADKVHPSSYGKVAKAALGAGQ